MASELSRCGQEAVLALLSQGEVGRVQGDRRLYGCEDYHN